MGQSVINNSIFNFQKGNFSYISLRKAVSRDVYRIMRRVLKSWKMKEGKVGIGIGHSGIKPTSASD